MCGVRTEQVPWGEGKKQLTKVYMQYLANWAQVLSWQEVARRFHTSWEKVFHSVEYVVEWGLKHRSLEGITAVGVDEIAWKKGHKYLTLVYQINNGAVRLLWIGKDRTEKTFHGFFDKLGAEKAKLIEYVCSDMSQVLITFEKPKTGHNAGDLQFGPDGFLWASFGEAGMYSKKMLEKLEGSLLGTIIRIDVRNTSDGKLYSIPEDNPKFDDPKVRPEVYARGFRNPWRWNFIDDKTILVGDVGRNDWEELNLVKGGEHFGWPVMEGFDCVPPEKNVKCNSEGLKEPMVSFSHEVLRSVIGGVVYNGSQIPWLKGKVIFADYLRGVMSVPLSKRGVVTKKWDQDLTFLHPKLPMKFGPNKGRTILPVDFFLGTDNEVYITAISGGVYKMVPISFWQSLRGFLYMLTSFR
jgi:hypothetical protein